MWRIEWTAKALRQTKKIKDKAVRSKIYDSVKTLENFPNASNIVKLKNRSDYRLRVGRWRVIFEAEYALKIIEVQEVRARNEDTY